MSDTNDTTDRKFTMSISDVADMFSLHPNTVRNMALKQDIPSVRVGRQFRFNKKELLTKLTNDFKKGEPDVT